MRARGYGRVSQGIRKPSLAGKDERATDTRSEGEDVGDGLAIENKDGFTFRYFSADVLGRDAGRSEKSDVIDLVDTR